MNRLSIVAIIICVGAIVLSALINAKVEKLSSQIQTVSASSTEQRIVLINVVRYLETGTTTTN